MSRNRERISRTRRIRRTTTVTIGIVMRASLQFVVLPRRFFSPPLPPTSHHLSSSSSTFQVHDLGASTGRRDLLADSEDDTHVSIATITNNHAVERIALRDYTTISNRVNFNKKNYGRVQSQDQRGIKKKKKKEFSKRKEISFEINPTYSKKIITINYLVKLFLIKKTQNTGIRKQGNQVKGELPRRFKEISNKWTSWFRSISAVVSTNGCNVICPTCNLLNNVLFSPLFSSYHSSHLKYPPPLPREYSTQELITCYTLRRVENASF
ncbi:hypothetical protein PUN28_004058 [Cardiocondyla obscurior]|uniref:Uncharacterized protein n=1 Tax=Cardiocondyla obscurior TaxID=286306 RepID=A0AAW2GM21_9HYME